MACPKATFVVYWAATGLVRTFIYLDFSQFLIVVCTCIVCEITKISLFQMFCYLFRLLIKPANTIYRLSVIYVIYLFVTLLVMGSRQSWNFDWPEKCSGISAKKPNEDDSSPILYASQQKLWRTTPMILTSSDPMRLDSQNNPILKIYCITYTAKVTKQKTSMPVTKRQAWLPIEVHDLIKCLQIFTNGC